MGEPITVCESLIVRTKSAVYLVEPPNPLVLGDVQYKVTKKENCGEDSNRNNRTFPVNKRIEGRELRLEEGVYLELVDVGFKSDDVVICVCSNDLDYCK